MSGYTPGEGYDKGFKCRMNGGQRPVQADNSVDPYWNEYSMGWKDADDRIVQEARQRNTVIVENDKSKFIQD